MDKALVTEQYLEDIADAIRDRTGSTDTYSVSEMAPAIRAMAPQSDVMYKSVYDIDDDGIVDNAEKVNNHTVDKDVPSDAKFTDTVYDDTQIRSMIGTLSNLNTTEKSNLVGAVNEVDSDIQTLTNHVADTGVKNFARPVEEDFGNRNIIFTPVAKGGIHVEGTSDGANAQNATMADKYSFRLKAGSYILSLYGTTRTDIRVYLRKNTTNVNYADINTPYNFTVSNESDAYSIMTVFVTSGATVDETIYYMIRPANVSDATFTPYAKTNVELTQGLSEVSDLVLDQGGITTKSYAPVISVIDALPVNAVDVKTKVEPIQSGSGTPSPSNVRPISGRTEVKATRCGKNLVEKILHDKNIKNNGEIVESANQTDLCIAKIVKGVTYTVSDNVSVDHVYAFYNDEPVHHSISYSNSRTVTNSPTFIAPIDGYVAFRVALNYAYGQIEVGNIASAYEAPNVDTYTIQLGDTYYGGTLDVTTGEFVVDWKCIDLGTRDWYVAIAESNVFQTTPISDIKIPTSAAERKEGIISSNYSVSSGYVIDSTMDDKSMLKHDNGRLYIRDTSYSDATTFQTAMSGVQFAYELATPYTIQLTPQEIQMLQGNNTLFTDCGDVSVSYYANGVKNLEAIVSDMQSDADGAMHNQRENGAVNLLENTASSAVVNGVTFTVNSDGTVIANGTASAIAQIGVNVGNAVFTKTGKFRLSGCPAGNFNKNVDLRTNVNVDGGASKIDYGNGVEFSKSTNSSMVVFITINKNFVANNLVFKPMITYADVPNSDYAHYVPYAKSNKELTDEQFFTCSTKTDVNIKSDFVSSDSYTVTEDGWYIAILQTIAASNIPTFMSIDINGIRVNTMATRGDVAYEQLYSPPLKIRKGTIIAFAGGDANVHLSSIVRKLT